MIGSEVYRKRGGQLCPNCNSTDIEGGSATVESVTAYQRVSCLVCGARWDDTYELTGYSDLRVGGVLVEVEDD